MKKILGIVVVALVALAGVGTWWALSKAPDGETPATEKQSPAAEKRSPDRFISAGETSSCDGKASPATDSPQPEADSSEEESMTEEEKAEAAAEAKVEAFDNLTDKWMEPSKKGVTMADVDAFVKTFREVPKDRQDECVHRALNLVPDENVMLLAGILMDKTMDKEIVETVFNDILNRDEDVKMPIMQQIHKDKTHPCWADVAWILDVTGEKKE